MKRKNNLLVLISSLFLLFSLPNIETTKEKNPFRFAKATPLSSASVANEPRFNDQFHFEDINYGDIYSKYTGEGVTVAIIDSGININHVDYWNGSQTNISNKSAYVEERGTYYSNVVIQTVEDNDLDIIADSANHGTNVAGTIGALVNGIGGAGVSPKVNLMVLKVNYLLGEIDAAVRYAANYGADIINMSIGAYNESFTDSFGDFNEGWAGTGDYLQTSMNYAHSKGVTLIAAAGNENTNRSSYPASNNHVIGVGALAKKSNSTIANYSNYGTNNVDIFAPGSVYVTDVGSETKYVETQGTSFASPIVASAAALYKEANPYATPDQIETALVDRSVAFSGSSDAGRLDLKELLSDVKVEGVEISPKNMTLRVGEEAQLTATISPSDATDKEVMFISNNVDIATVDEDTGLVRAVGVGTTQIGVLTNDGPFVDYSTITVVAPSTPIAITNIANNDGNITLGVGDTKLLDLTLTPSNGSYSNLNFSSSAPSVVSVNSNGLLTALSTGSASITVSSKLGSYSTNIDVNVASLVDKSITYSFTNKSWGTTAGSDDWISGKEGLGYSNNGVQVATGQSGANARSPVSFNNIQSIVVGYATNGSTGAGNIKIYSLPTTSSSGTQIGSFTVTTAGGTSRRNTNPYIPTESTKNGYIKIEVNVTTNSIYLCDITINYKEAGSTTVNVTGVNFVTNNSSLTIGDTLQLAHTISPSNATNKNVSYTSSNSSVASVSNTGLVTASSVGSTTITIKTSDGNFTDTVSISVSAPTLYEKTLTLNTSNFKKNYIFGNELDLAHLSAIYTDQNNVSHNISGSSLTLVSGNTKTLGQVTLVFSYQGASDDVVISVTNVGAPTSATISHQVTGLSFSPALTTTGIEYASIVSGGITFSGDKLRISTYNNLNNFMIIDGGYFRNVTPLDNLVSIKFDYLTSGSPSAYQTVRFSSSPITTDAGNIAESIGSSKEGTSRIVNAPSDSKYFRLDVSSANLQANITLTYANGEALSFTPLEQATAYYDYFMNITHEECLVSNVKASTWLMLENEYNAMGLEAQSELKDLAVNELNSRYSLIINKYHYSDFIYLTTNNEQAPLFNKSSSSILLIIIIISSTLGVSSFFFLQKKKKSEIK